jgi:hypothetical protein
VCSKTNVLIVYFYRRGNYLWSCKDNRNIKRFFGDKNRAINWIKFKKIKLLNYHLNIPSDFKRFLFDYNNSEFIECNRTLFKMNAKLLQNSKRNKTLKSLLATRLHSVTSKLEDYHKSYWLAAGTLLGLHS